MKEQGIDLWDAPAQWRVITTNGTVTKDGRAVMGRGCALEAAQRFPRLRYELGERNRKYGNDLHFFPDYQIITLPVKHNWWEKADIDLIKSSLFALGRTDQDLITRVYMPRPGCGNGGLRWEDVRPICETYLDDRFTVVWKAEKVGADPRQ